MARIAVELHGPDAATAQGCITHPHLGQSLAGQHPQLAVGIAPRQGVAIRIAAAHFDTCSGQAAQVTMTRHEPHVSPTLDRCHIGHNDGAVHQARFTQGTHRALRHGKDAVIGEHIHRITAEANRIQRLGHHRHGQRHRAGHTAAMGLNKRIAGRCHDDVATGSAAVQTASGSGRAHYAIGAQQGSHGATLGIGQRQRLGGRHEVAA